MNTTNETATPEAKPVATAADIQAAVTEFVKKLEALNVSRETATVVLMQLAANSAAGTNVARAKFIQAIGTYFTRARAALGAQ